MSDHPRWDDDPRDRDDERRPEREIVHDARNRAYTLRGSETRTLSTVGAFRVVPARELRGHASMATSANLRHHPPPGNAQALPSSPARERGSRRRASSPPEPIAMHSGCMSCYRTYGHGDGF